MLGALLAALVLPSPVPSTVAGVSVEISVIEEKIRLGFKQHIVLHDEPYTFPLQSRQTRCVVWARPDRSSIEFACVERDVMGGGTVVCKDGPRGFYWRTATAEKFIITITCQGGKKT